MSAGDMTLAAMRTRKTHEWPITDGHDTRDNDWT